MIRIIGLGSPFGDDDVGWRVLERLRGRLPATIDLQKLDRPGAALINWFGNVSHLVIVDAIGGDTAPGKIWRLSGEDLGPEHRQLSCHQLDLVQTLALASTLGRLPARVEILGVSIADAKACMAIVDNSCQRLAEEIRHRFTDSGETGIGAARKARTFVWPGKEDG